MEREGEREREKERERDTHSLQQSSASKHSIKLTEAIKINNNGKKGRAGRWKADWRERKMYSGEEEEEEEEEEEMRKSVLVHEWFASWLQSSMF